MKLNYVDYSKYKYKVERLYLESFPKEERFPFWILEECSKEDNSMLYAIVDNDTFVGMCYLVNCGNAYYLMYIAVEQELRDKGYGSKILNDLKNKYNSLFLSIEYNKDEISIKRKQFYLRNEFYKTNKCYEDTGVLYEVLCTNKKYEITEDNMKKRYSNMSSIPRIYEIISNTFNTNEVKLINK